MRCTIVLDFINKCITEKLYKQARKQEELLVSDCFTAYYAKGSVVYWLLLFAISVALTYFFSCFNADRIIIYMVIITSIGSFVIFLYYVSYRCYVDDTRITTIVLWLFKKRIFWKDVTNVKVQEYVRRNKPLERDVIIRNKQNKVIFSCSYDLVGFTLIVKKAKKACKNNR